MTQKFFKFSFLVGEIIVRDQFGLKTLIPVLLLPTLMRVENRTPYLASERAVFI